MDSIIETYFAPNRTLADLREIAEGRVAKSPIR